MANPEHTAAFRGLEPHLYDDQDGLLTAMAEKVIGPAKAMAKEHRTVNGFGDSAAWLLRRGVRAMTSVI